MDNMDIIMGIKWVYNCDNCNTTPDKCTCDVTPSNHSVSIEDTNPNDYPF